MSKASKPEEFPHIQTSIKMGQKMREQLNDLMEVTGDSTAGLLRRAVDLLWVNRFKRYHIPSRKYDKKDNSPVTAPQPEFDVESLAE